MTAIQRSSDMGTSDVRARSIELGGIRATLEQQRLFRLEQLDELAAQARAADAAIDGPLWEVADALRAGAASALSHIEAALMRIDNGTYGRCVTCRATIAPERLELVPMTAHCIRCARARASRRVPANDRCTSSRRPKGTTHYREPAGSAGAGQRRNPHDPELPKAQEPS